MFSKIDDKVPYFPFTHCGEKRKKNAGLPLHSFFVAANKATIAKFGFFYQFVIAFLALLWYYTFG